MSDSVQFVDATPVLASLDIQRSVDFFVSKLGFDSLYAKQGEYGIVRNGPVGIHFWACSDPAIPKATGCRIQVREIGKLFETCQSHGIVHPNAPLASTQWGNDEFAILDPDNNLITFHQPSES
jgi:catechol 2,3-dioxygenase-like lactoylglutathione lyase family enzyme